ncbi:MAG: hypothetical protein KGJ13_06970 [Patescibacteria group bacterium]|nr:hypothetical protein [Patescibacteria group bacterium]
MKLAIEIFLAFLAGVYFRSFTRTASLLLIWIFAAAAMLAVLVFPGKKEKTP